MIPLQHHTDQFCFRNDVSVSLPEMAMNGLLIPWCSTLLYYVITIVKFISCSLTKGCHCLFIKMYLLLILSIFILYLSH